MITWIKFSERQPEKEGNYLFFMGAITGMVLYERWPRTDCEFKPAYWAEINLPGVKVSGIHGPFNDPETIKALKELNEKGAFFGWIPGYEVNVVQSPPVNPRKAKCQCTHTPKETPMPEKPLCKACRWCRSTYYCVNLKLEHVVDCEGPPLYLCSLAREDREHFCGPEGEWFEAKEEHPDNDKKLAQLAEIKDMAQRLMNLCTNIQTPPLPLGNVERFATVEALQLIYNWAAGLVSAIKSP